MTTAQRTARNAVITAVAQLIAKYDRTERLHLEARSAEIAARVGGSRGQHTKKARAAAAVARELRTIQLIHITGPGTRHVAFEKRKT